MKKNIIIALEIAVIVILAMLINFTIKHTDPETLNAESYQLACERVESRFGDSEDYTIKPRVTINDVVTSYKVCDADGEVVEFISFDRK